MEKKTAYAGVGVDYDVIDCFKRAAQIAGEETAFNLSRSGFSEIEASRGESVYLIGDEKFDRYVAHVEEGLGTKNLVADAMYRITGYPYYDYIAQDTVAMIVNDMITRGALPVSIAMHLAVGDSKWFEDEKLWRYLLRGWKKACDLAGVSYGCGETSVLKDIVSPGAVVLSGSALGVVKPKEKLLAGSNIQDGDAIVLVKSSGIHANGLTLARKIAAELPSGYSTLLCDGKMYGEALLQPTIIYVPLMRSSLKEGLAVRYAANITGHGWRKLMRAREPFLYVIENIPEPQPVFNFIQERSGITDEEAYGTFNMGAGFAIYLGEKDVGALIRIAREQGFEAIYAGHVEKRGNEKKVVILPKNLEYRSESLAIR